MKHRRLSVVSLALALSMILVPDASAAEPEEPNTSPLVCDAYAGDPDPILERHEWQLRDANNVACATQRQQDATNPAFKSKHLEAQTKGYPEVTDPFRIPEEWKEAEHGKMERFTFLGNRGTRMNARLYSPLEGSGPFPAIAFSPGLQSYNEVNAWFGEDLASAGYIVLVIDPQGQGASESGCRKPDGTSDTCTGHNNITSAIDFLMTTPAEGEQHPHAGSQNHLDSGALVFNPEFARTDRSRLGVAGHSLGAINATPVAQTDPRVDAIVAYDNLDGTLSSSITPRTPALYFYADYKFPAFSYPMAMPPSDDPTDVRNVIADHHMGIFNRLSGAGVDVMSVTTRATTHYEWGYQPWPASFPASRYGERIASHYTLAWFDRYLKDDETALARLTAHHFDGSADAHSIGAGTFDSEAWDPAVPGSGNVPYKIKGKCAANLLSFYYKSAYSFPREGPLGLASDDMRARGCTQAPSDTDADGVTDSADNCPQTANVSQADADADGVGDACDPDADGDAVMDSEDNCRATANSSQADADGDGAGDACDPDADGDGIDDTPPPTNPDQCKNGGWRKFNNPTFRNQRECASHASAP